MKILMKKFLFEFMPIGLIPFLVFFIFGLGAGAFWYVIISIFSSVLCFSIGVVILRIFKQEE